MLNGTIMYFNTCGDLQVYLPKEQRVYKQTADIY